MKSAPSRGLIAFTVMLPTLIEIIDTSIVNVSLDHIRGSLSAGIEEATWAINAYLVANAIVIPMSGWLSRGGISSRSARSARPTSRPAAAPSPAAPGRARS